MKHLPGFGTKLILIGGLIFCFFQCKESTSSEMNFSSLVVSDFERSLSWYKNHLDFIEVDKTINNERGLKLANLKRKSDRLEIIELSTSINPTELIADQSKRPIVQGIFKVGFTVTGFDDWINRWEKADLEFNGSVVTDPVTGKRMIILNDPDGNRIQIFEK